MRYLRLTEYATCPDVELSTAEIGALHASRALTITPSVRNPGSYDLTAGSRVGVICLDLLTVEIRPKVPISRLLFLLSYHLDPGHWRDILSGFAEEEDLLEALIPGFVFQVRYAVRRGVLQGYRTEEDAAATVRGRIRFAEQIQRRYGIAPPVEVSYDEFTEDITENRLLKAAIARLGRLRIRSPRSRQLLREFDLVLERVRLIHYHSGDLPDVSYTRLNAHYRPAVELAKLILRATSFELRQGPVRTSAFLADMNTVFENFVVAALREALRVSARAFPQGASGKPLFLDDQRVVSLRPDISWWESGRCLFAGDVKYKRLAGGDDHHADLYQLLAYVIAADLPGGLLIYAEGGSSLRRHHIRQAGRDLWVTSLNLEAEPDGILGQIRSLAGHVRDLRESAVMGPSQASTPG